MIKKVYLHSESSNEYGFTFTKTFEILRLFFMNYFIKNNMFLDQI